MKKLVALCALLGAVSANVQAGAMFNITGFVSQMYSSLTPGKALINGNFPVDASFSGTDALLGQQIYFMEPSGASVNLGYGNLSRVPARSGVAGGFSIGASCQNESYITSVDIGFRFGGGKAALGLPTTVAQYVGGGYTTNYDNAATPAPIAEGGIASVPMTNSYMSNILFQNRFGMDVGVGFGVKASQSFSAILSFGYALQQGRIKAPYIAQSAVASDAIHAPENLNALPLSTFEKSQTFHGLYGRLAVYMNVTDSAAIFVALTKRYFFEKQVKLAFPADSYMAAYPVLDMTNPADPLQSSVLSSLPTGSEIKPKMQQTEIAVGVQFNVKAQ